MSFTVTTWNLLAQAYIKPERYAGIDPAHLEATVRAERITRRVRTLDSDIFLLQEVEPAMMQALQRALPHHTGHLEQKHGKPDGSAVFLRDTIGIETLLPVHYEAVEPGYDHVGLAAGLTIDGRQLAIASTHLRWQPRETPDHVHLGRRQLAAWPQATAHSGTQARGHLRPVAVEDVRIAPRAGALGPGARHLPQPADRSAADDAS